MKKILAILSIGILILTGGCSNTADVAEVSSAAPVSVPESSMQDTSGDISDMRARPSDIPRSDGQNEVLGKITAINENKITIAIGTMNIPEGMQEEMGTPPTDDGSQPEGGQSQRRGLPDGGPRPDDARRDSSAPQGEHPAGGARKGTRGGFSESLMNLEYTGEEIHYTLSDSIEITKGIGQNNDKITITDLAEGDIVRLLLGETEQPVSIQVFEMNK